MNFLQELKIIEIYEHGEKKALAGGNGQEFIDSCLMEIEMSKEEYDDDSSLPSKEVTESAINDFRKRH